MGRAHRQGGPYRTCVGCRAVRRPEELERITADADGSLRIGRTHPGRGAWLCRGQVSCLQEALRRKALARALRCPVSEHSLAALIKGPGR